MSLDKHVLCCSEVICQNANRSHTVRVIDHFQPPPPPTYSGCGVNDMQFKRISQIFLRYFSTKLQFSLGDLHKRLFIVRRRALLEAASARGRYSNLESKLCTVCLTVLNTRARAYIVRGERSWQANVVEERRLAGMAESDRSSLCTAYSTRIRTEWMSNWRVYGESIYIVWIRDGFRCVQSP